MLHHSASVVVAVDALLFDALVALNLSVDAMSADGAKAATSNGTEHEAEEHRPWHFPKEQHDLTHCAPQRQRKRSAVALEIDDGPKRLAGPESS
ncbi:hypothetical protein [Xanthomonas arboricola]|uniref:hypothetical protein n=1 Tax=Xanthomonas arboricola TaxID=56448 RepID=UPI00161B12C8|nr:hypothetical protein [Xanthomonas arboricola]MBB5676845.1 hypothetical protein [Xanthomonas arboricola]